MVKCNIQREYRCKKSARVHRKQKRKRQAQSQQIVQKGGECIVTTTIKSTDKSEYHRQGNCRRTGLPLWNCKIANADSCPHPDGEYFM